MSHQKGSAWLSTMTCLMALGFAGKYVKDQAVQQQSAISHAAWNASSTSTEEAMISTLSLLKGQLSTKNISGVYLPGLIADHYYESGWNFQNLPANPQSGISLLNGRQLAVKVQNVQAMGVSEAAEIMRHAKSLIDMKAQDASVDILQTNFTADQRFAESIDVQISSLVQGPQGTRPVALRARVPLQSPIPSDPILEASPAGMNAFTRNLSDLEPGDYDFRVLGSGVVYKAVVTVNGVDKIEVGGFDSKTGRISHRADNYLAKDEVIGSFRYRLSGNNLDNIACVYVPLGNTYTFEIALEGPSPEVKVVSPIQTASIRLDVVASGPIEDIDRKYCTDECPYFEDDIAFFDGMQQHIENYGFSKDASSLEISTYNKQRMGIPSHLKVCGNWSKSAAAFTSLNGVPPMQFVDIWQDAYFFLEEYISYTVPACKRRVLFQRNACGCFADDTQVLLGDGKSLKRIDQLTYDDQLWNPSRQGPVGIRRISRGPEPVPMLLIKAGPQVLTVTGKHPFPTPHGIRGAFDLAVGDQIQLQSQEWVSISAIQNVPASAQAPIVWNVELEAPNEDRDAHHLVANGLVTGDLLIQTLLESGREL